jgi:hypothetical protein
MSLNYRRYFMINGEMLTKMIDKSEALEERAKKVYNDLEKIKDKIYGLIRHLDKHGSAIEKETADDIKSSFYDISSCMEDTIRATKRITELAKLGKCDRYMATRLKMAVCEICAAEKQIWVLKEMLKIK